MSTLSDISLVKVVDEAIGTSDLQRLWFWIAMLAVLFLSAMTVNWIARYMLVRSQQLVSGDLRMLVTDRIQDARGFAGKERTCGRLANGKRMLFDVSPTHFITSRKAAASTC